MSKSKVIVPNIVRGGIAIPLGRNYYYMKGRKHSNGGIDIGKNPRTGLEVEDGEVMHISPNEVKVFSAQPFLNGKSPARKVMGGEDPNKVFNQQEQYKDRNDLNDDGTKKKRFGGQSINDKYVTKLTYKEEQDFRNWYSKVAKHKKLNPDPDADGQDYDYRGYWKNEDRNVILNSNSNTHFPDKYKTPNHPTFSNESIYSNSKTPGGTWIQSKGTWLFKHNDFTARQANRTKAYLTDSGEGYILGNDTIIPRKKLIGGDDNISYEQAVINRDNMRKETNKGNISIPYIKERNIKLTNAGKLTGAEFSENMLDSIAKYAAKANIPLETAVGLAGQESSLGNAKKNGYIPQKERGTIYASSLISNWSAGKDNPWNDLVATADKKSKGNKKKRDELIKLGWKYTKRLADKFDTNINTLQHGFEKFKSGTYNLKDPNHTKDVLNTGKVIANSPEYQKWLKEKGLKIYNDNKKRMGGLSRSKDYGSKSKPYPNVNSEDFAGKNRSYPIPTKADAIDALRLAGLHGRSDIKTKVYSKYPELRKKAKAGGIYSVTVNGETKLRMLPYTGNYSKAELGIYKKTYANYLKEDEEKEKKRLENSVPGPGNYTNNPWNRVSPVITGNGISTSYNQLFDDANRYKDDLTKKIEQKVSSVAPKLVNTNNYNDKKDKKSTLKDYWSDNKENIILNGIGLTSNIVGGLSSYFSNKYALNKMVEPIKPTAPMLKRAAKLKTRININPQLAKMSEAVAKYERSVDNNTASSQVALARKQQARNNALLMSNELYGDKENKETELINRDRLNQQSVANSNVESYNRYLDRMTEYNNRVAEFKNNIINKKAENKINLINTINAGIQNIVGNSLKRSNENKNISAIALANPNIPVEAMYAAGLINKATYNLFMKTYRNKKKD